MKTIKPQRLGLLTKVFDHGGTPQLVISALAFFPFDAPGNLASEVAMWKLTAEELGADGVLDLGMPKPRGEVLLTARAYPFGGAKPTCSVRVKLGSVDKTLYVVGDRRWKGSAATAPEPFTEMPITWANAFGGAGYAQNPLGKGYEPVGDEHPLPNVEDPKRLVSSPGNRPAPAGFGGYDATWPQRYAKIGTYDKKWLEQRYPGFAADLDPGYFNAAPADQQIEGYFRGDEPLTLENMHPDVAVLEGRLPGVKARIFVNFAKDAIELQEVSMRAETVHLFPHAQRGVVIFRGVVKVAEDDGADVRHLVAAFEALGEPKPLDHYATVLSQRVDHKKSHLYSLRDRDLLPDALARAPEDDGEMKKVLASEGFLQDNLRRRTESEIAKATAAANAVLVAQGLEPLPPPAPLPPRKKAPDLDELPAFVEDMEEQLAKSKVDGDARFAEMQKVARVELAKHGVDYDKAVLEEQAKAGGPPKFSAAAQMQMLRDQAALVRSHKVPSPALEAKLEDPAFFAKLQKAEAMVRNSYRLFAHYMVPAARLTGEASAGVRAEVVAARESGESLAERDFTGADLSHLDLHGVDLRMAFLECANFEGTDLHGATLTGAVLTRANLAGANLVGAKLALANLGGANLTGADVSGETDLAGAVLVKADLSHAKFAGAKLTGAYLGEAKFDQTDLRGASAAGLTFLKSDLRGLLLGGADLRDCVFIEAVLDGIDFTRAVLQGAVMVTVSAKGCTFRGAKLPGLVVVKDSTLEGSSFAGADLSRALLRSTNLAGADFSDAVLTGADLSESDLTGASFEHAVAQGARFSKSNLSRANLKRADLMDAILERAKLRGASLESANLFRADMLKADVDSGTITKGANLKSIRFIQTKRPNGER
jgi:uncharacterized protein YjbI with pentapeptide repeats